MACNGCEFRPELYYDKEFQIWVSKQDDGTLKVGMTDISQSIVATIESAKWPVPVPNFMECVINEGNAQVLNDPSLLNKNPYEMWIASVTPEQSIDDALSGFLTGDEAEKGYCERALKEDIHCERLE